MNVYDTTTFHDVQELVRERKWDAEARVGGKVPAANFSPWASDCVYMSYMMFSLMSQNG